MLDTEKFKTKLLQSKEDLEKSVSYLKSSDPYLDKNASDSGNTLDDDITEIEGHDRITATRLQVKQDLASVEAALARLEKGTYGECLKCGVEIPVERLEVMPTATIHLQCPKN